MNKNTNQLREIILDCETTGLSPAKGERMIEIACLEMIDKNLTGKLFHSYMNPECEVSHHAYKVHGISNEFLQDKPLFSHIAKELMDFIDDSPLVIHNAKFDMSFLNAELKNTEFSFNGDVVDTLALARKKFPKQPVSLDNLCTLFNIDISNRSTHGAVIDTELLAEVYIKLTE